MLNQRHSSSGISSKISKTTSRPKFINRTTQQTHNVSVQSGKQMRTLRYPSKNKSCLIPKHLAQSTESHIVCSNERSQKCTSTSMNKNKNYFTQNFNPNLSQGQYTNVQPRSSLVQSNLTMPYQNFNSTSLNNQSKVMYQYRPFISLQTQNINLKSNIKANLQQKLPLQNILKLKGVQSKKQPYVKNHLIKQKILQKQIQQMFLYKNMQLTKALQQMQRFCICVKQLKWICQETHLLVKKYNQGIRNYYKEYFSEFKKKGDLDNILKESQQLLKRFNQLQLLNSGQVPMLNFNLLANNTFNASLLNQNSNSNLKDQPNPTSIIHQSSNPHSRSSPQNIHSWSKLIENIQQDHLQRPVTQPLINDDNKNFSIRTFQITENNSPYKNKTLNQLIRVSELRKTEFIENFGTEDKENNPRWSNQHNGLKDSSYNDKMFNKKEGISYIVSKQASGQKDPFDSIHLPHFSTKNQANKQKEKALLQKQKAVLQVQQCYEKQISGLKKQIQDLDKENNEYFRKLRTKNNEISRQNQELKQKLKSQLKETQQCEREVYHLVEIALGELVNCAKVNRSLESSRRAISSYNNHPGFQGKTQLFLDSEPKLMIGNKAFFQLVHCLEEVLKMSKSHKQVQKSPESDRRKKDIINQAVVAKKIQNQKVAIHKLENDKNVLTRQVDQLERIKSLLEQEIIKLEGNLKEVEENKQQCDIFNQYPLEQMLFVQAFTIEEMLQLEENTQETEWI